MPACDDLHAAARGHAGRVMALILSLLSGCGATVELAPIGPEPGRSDLPRIVPANSRTRPAPDGRRRVAANSQSPSRDSQAPRRPGPMGRLERGEPLSLADCRSLALAHNYDLLAAGHGEALARWAHETAKALRRPRLIHATSYSLQTPDPPSFSIQTIRSVQTDPTDPTVVDTFRLEDVRVSTGDASRVDLRTHLSYSVYDFGRGRMAVQAAGLDARAAAIGRELARRNVRFLVAGAFLQVHEAAAMQTVVEASLPALEKTVADQRAAQASGRAVRSDTLLLEVALARRRQERVNAANAIRQSTWRLNHLMGLAIDRPTRLAPPPEPPAASARGAGLAAAGVYLAAALRRHPALRRNRTEQQALDLRASAAAAERLPELSVGAGHSHTSADSVFSEADTFTGTVNLNWTLYAGGARRARARAARERHGAGLTEGARLASEIALQVRQAHLRVEQVQADRRIAAQAVAQAEQELTHMRERKNAGLATQREVLDADARLMGERFARLRTAYAYHLARAQLELAVGEDLAAVKPAAP